MAKKPEPKKLRLDALELALLQRNVMARELREVKISTLDIQVAQFEKELHDLVIDRIGVDLRAVTINTQTGEITNTPQQKVG